jgi:precorrin-2/cobalt-factor-2 C20-methyltransferase
LAILPALYRVEELEQILTWANVIVLMKVASVYEKVWKILEKRGLLEQARIVEKATLPDQKIYSNLTDFPKLNLSYFSLLIVVTENYSVND